MIKTFKGEAARAIWEGRTNKSISKDLAKVAIRRLMALDAADDPIDLRSPPSNRLEALKGKRKGQYAIRVNSQYRICFVWRSGNAYDVELVDYH